MFRSLNQAKIDAVVFSYYKKEKLPKELFTIYVYLFISVNQGLREER